MPVDDNANVSGTVQEKYHGTRQQIQRAVETTRQHILYSVYPTHGWYAFAKSANGLNFINKDVGFYFCLTNVLFL